MSLRRGLALLALPASLAVCGGEPDSPSQSAVGDESELKAPPKGALRIATFNTSLNRPTAGALVEELTGTESEPARAAATILQTVRPHVVLVQELDHDSDGASARLFHDHYLARGQGALAPLDYPYRFSPEVNTGVPSGLDIDGNGEVGGAGDAYGFGEFPGQYGFTVYSTYPIATADIRCFRTFLWKDMPGALFPDDAKTDAPADFWPEETTEKLRLSSKNHCDVPVDVDGTRVHVLVAHPTPPAFDGREDRNGKRNHDEIRLWADYVTPGKGDYLVDDDGKAGGLAAGSTFFVLGDQNSDPNDGSSQAIRQLLESPLVNAKTTPRSVGAAEAASLQGGVNGSHKGDPAFDTGDFGDSFLGNIRLDYVLPSADVTILDAQVFWPKEGSKARALITHSDHRAVWLDVTLP